MYKINELDVLRKCINQFHTFDITVHHILVVLIYDYELSSLRWHNHRYIEAFLLIAEYKGFGKYDEAHRTFKINKENPAFKDLIT
jgi:hypothetical protein